VHIVWHDFIQMNKIEYRSILTIILYYLRIILGGKKVLHISPKEILKSTILCEKSTLITSKFKEK